MRRREFITLLGGSAAAWPLSARAQQPAKLPTVGFLGAGTPSTYSQGAFRQGLDEAGYVEGRNVTIEYRWAEGQYDRLPAMATFNVAGDPVKLGLVASLARPGSNATGVNSFLAELGAKQLGLLHELLPKAARIGLLVNPSNANVEGVTKDVMAAAATLGVQIDVVQASDSREIEAAFATLVRNKANALLIGSDVFFSSRRVQLATLTTRHAIPAVQNVREFAEVGGLMSYGTSLTEAFRQLGVYTGRILKGAKPADLPVVQSTKFEFVINLPTARALGIEIPPTLLARADEVIDPAYTLDSIKACKSSVMSRAKISSSNGALPRADTNDCQRLRRNSSA